MEKELYIHLGNDGTSHYGTKSGKDYLFYRNIEKGKIGKVDFLVDLKFDGGQDFSESVKKIIKEFYTTQKEIEFNRVFDYCSNSGELRIMFNENFPNSQDEVIEFIFSKIGSLK